MIKVCCHNELTFQGFDLKYNHVHFFTTDIQHLHKERLIII